MQSEHSANARRYLDGAVACIGTLTSWMSAFPRNQVAIVDPPRHASPPADASLIVLEATPWWSSPAAMAPELATARGVARRGWSEAINERALPAWFMEGLVEYTARRAVTPLFQGVNLSPGYAMLELRFFAGFVPRFVRIRLQPDVDGDPLPVYRAHPRVDPRTPSTPEEQRSLAAKTVLALNTLELWIGQPAFDAVLAQFVTASRSQPLTIDDFTGIASATTGQDLSWMLTPMLRGMATFDYAVADLQTRPSTAGGFETAVVVERRGDGQFTGATAPPDGPFESGRGIAVLVAFEDGDRLIDTWDGRDQRKTFRYRSASRAMSATVDPDRKLLLDVNRTNNSMAVATRARMAATRWSARWMLWLEQLLMTYAALV